MTYKVGEHYIMDTSSWPAGVDNEWEGVEVVITAVRGNEIAFDATDPEFSERNSPRSWNFLFVKSEHGNGGTAGETLKPIVTPEQFEATRESLRKALSELDS